MYATTGQLSEHQQGILSTIERACSCLSVVASMIVIATFLSSRQFRKPINRLIFWATWGNLMSNVATLIAESSVRTGSAALCQFQAFVIQWFLPADSLWALAMAFNVYLVTFKKYDTRRLRQLEWKYGLFCYGLPFIPAFILLFIKSKKRGKVYGESVIWCWIASPWDFLQVATFYGPVWFVILSIFAIYIGVGLSMYQHQRAVQKIITPPLDHESHTQLSGDMELGDIAHTSPLPGGSSHPIEQPMLLLPSPPHASPEAGMAPIRPSPMQRSSGLNQTSTLQPRDGGSYNTSISGAYMRYALLFAFALFVTWVPPSANRVYALTRHNEYLFGLTCASSFSLPLQGFWNAMIYITVSWQAVRALLRDFGRGLRSAFKLNTSRLRDG
ncbi:G protein coupled receptor family protein [Aspergillus clavatus NRRL 1]|uniref:G protein coupled receptor family protein n=1 Tax=Aspergillus clavatus (strain ATCC 1007 / CBS 513.65 / DSM 816 / NCTC 3887 / NRRL 1 / QM 1276 / 107) TaxID=344612 RepID=A1CCP1_ASPCL|nr:G protein coupled receptor family protein [Aspergillus clavatus NRRL 1]EAW12298.1 G protein coupled receptor family protein [Aspergillus clavatus NRRL 1]